MRFRPAENLSMTWLYPPSDLQWGQTVSGVVDRQTAHFFRIPISQDDLNTGIIINCKSVDNQDKFKVVFFDNQGTIAETAPCSER